VLCFFLPFLLSSVGATATNEARRIYMEVNAPHHYDVPRFAWDFATWAGFQLLGLGALLGPIGRGGIFPRRFLHLMAGTWLLVVPAALLSSLVVVRSVQQLFAWRVCAEADLLAQAAFAAGLVTIFCDGKLAWNALDRWAKVLAGLGLLGLFLGATARGNWTATLLVAALFVVAFGVARGFRTSRLLSSGLPLEHVRAALLITLVAVNIARFSRLKRYSNLLSGGDETVAELCQWAERQTSENALFLTPPEEEEIRFRCHRAIVVDWKSGPSLPNEVLQWYARLEDVTGRRPLRSKADLVGYQELDAARIARLRERYGIDYVVVERGHELDLGITPAFAGQRFVVYALAGPSIAIPGPGKAPI
jgi:hypothetical protein